MQANKVEMVEDGSLMGIREVTRVHSLEDCLDRCRRCQGLVHYPDNVCIIFNKLTRIVLSSFGATCCFAVEEQQEMECSRCDGEEIDKDEMEGSTNLLNVWTRNPQTNSSYKVIPYNCQETPTTYETVCAREGGHLASIHSQQEDAFISTLGIRSCHCKHIGLYSTRTSKGELFRWRDGTPADYLNWKAGEPYGRGPHCAYIWQTNGWVSGKCTDAYGGCCAVCKKNH